MRSYTGFYDTQTYALPITEGVPLTNILYTVSFFKQVDWANKNAPQHTISFSMLRPGAPRVSTEAARVCWNEG